MKNIIIEMENGVLIKPVYMDIFPYEGKSLGIPMYFHYLADKGIEFLPEPLGKIKIYEEKLKTNL